MPPSRFDPQSTDAVIATLLARQQAADERQKAADEATALFREQLLKRLDEGSVRMGTIEKELGGMKADIAEVKIQTTKTNGRVNAHDAQLETTAKALATLKAQLGELRGRLRPFLALAAKAGTVGATLIAVWYVFDWMVDKGLLRLGQ